MNYIPFSMIKAIHEQTHSAHPNAPVIPHRPARPRRHPVRAVRRLLQARGALPQPAQSAPVQSAPVQPAPMLTLVPGTDHELCEAEVRDRGTTTASAARAC
ncbi:hypothetical protein EV652_12255 [Kribbella steppae]|uniref:Uncharacterized protein n=1 Tax=Kribbella steppae TaxID=2512223 RepID=A0A4V2RXT0_9ACTN|nr:hypothetical protein [Kribbella steppae]TCO15397.1 hypothetical protein EV652_12255 [Kribbella steppae]